jgi:hypothetical protein
MPRLRRLIGAVLIAQWDLEAGLRSTIYFFATGLREEWAAQ